MIVPRISQFIKYIFNKCLLHFHGEKVYYSNMSESRRRITGTEMEWSPWIRHEPDSELVPCPNSLPDQLLRTCLSDQIIRDPKSGMTTNGSRIYQDLSSFIEYATPEDTSYWSTVTNELAGQWIVLDTLERHRNFVRIIHRSRHVTNVLLYQLLVQTNTLTAFAEQVVREHVLLIDYHI